MGLFFADLVRERSFATGKGDFALAGALPGHRRLADAVPTGARFHYCIAGVTRPDEWETGEGLIAPGNALVRLPLASSAGGAAVSFSPGLKTVALTVAASWFARMEAPTTIADVGGLQAALDGKAGAVHGHQLADVAGLEAALGGKAAAAHGHAVADVSGLHAALDARQPIDAELSAIAGLASAADRLPYFTGPGSAALATFTAFGRSLADDADAGAARATLGLGTLATQAAASVSITGGTIGGLAALSCAGGATLGDAPSDMHTINGALTLSVANGRVIADESQGPYLQIRPNSGQSGRLIFTENAVADRWAIGTVPGDGNLYFSLGSGLANPKLSLTAAGVSVSGNAELSGELRVNQVRVVGGRIGGWGAPTGTATRTAFDTAGVTTAQLAERVKALIDDLRGHGLIGS